VVSRVSSAAEREAREVAHGRRIRRNAEWTWGWGSPAGQVRAERRAHFLVELGQIEADSCVLEVGCGTGVFSAKLARTGAQIDAIDVSPDLLEEARHRRGCEDVVFIPGNVETGQGLRGPYDAVLGVSVLHHLDLSSALRHLVRVLKVGGRFVFTEPNLWNPQVWLERNVRWLRPLLGVSPDETAFARTALVRTLEEAGLTSVSVKPFDWLHPWTPRPLIAAVKAWGSVLERTPLVRELSGSLLIVGRKPARSR